MFSMKETNGIDINLFHNTLQLLIDTKAIYFRRNNEMFLYIATVMLLLYCKLDICVVACCL